MRTTAATASSSDLGVLHSSAAVQGREKEGMGWEVIRRAFYHIWGRQRQQAALVGVNGVGRATGSMRRDGLCAAEGGAGAEWQMGLGRAHRCCVLATLDPLQQPQQQLQQQQLSGCCSKNSSSRVAEAAAASIQGSRPEGLPLPSLRSHAGGSWWCAVLCTRASEQHQHHSPPQQQQQKHYGINSSDAGPPDEGFRHHARSYLSGP